MIAISAAVAYHGGDDSRRARPLGTAPRPGLGAPKRVVSRPFRGRGAIFHWRGAFRARFRLPIRPAVGRRLPPSSGAEIRDRSGAEPAQTTRGRGGAPGRDRPREARPGARTGGTGLRRVPDAVQSRRPFSPRAPLRRRRRPAVAARPGQRPRSSPPPCGRSARAAGRPQSPRPRLPKR